ncbi:MAG: hypothetical protein AAF456_14285 [Planctomycetota bacterium]
MARTKAKSSSSKSAKTGSKKKLDQLNETGERKGSDRRSAEKTVSNDRRKAHRRRQIDPTTCEREYNDREIEFMQAMDEYKRLSGRMFPTCSEILEVLHNLGYRQIAEQKEIYNPDQPANGENADETFDEFNDQLV